VLLRLLLLQCWGHWLRQEQCQHLHLRLQLVVCRLLAYQQLLLLQPGDFAALLLQCWVHWLWQEQCQNLHLLQLVLCPLLAYQQLLPTDFVSFCMHLVWH